MPATHDYAGIAAGQVATVNDAKIQSFEQALDFIEKVSGKSQFLVGDTYQLGKRTDKLNLMVVEAADGKPTSIGVKLYDTVIVIYRDDETFTTDSGGYVTPTTCSRIGQFTPDRYYAHSSDRMLSVGGYYGEKHLNRFGVRTKGVVGPVTPFPQLKRKRAKGSHGTLRWQMDPEGSIYSTNSKYPDEMVYPEILYDKIGCNEKGEQTGDFTGPIPVSLVRAKVSRRELHDVRLKGVQKSAVPLALVNQHRKLWGMPEIEVVG